MDHVHNHACVTLDGPSYHENIRFIIEIKDVEKSIETIRNIIYQLPCAPNAYDFLLKQIKSTRLWSLRKLMPQFEQPVQTFDTNRDEEDATDDEQEIDDTEFGLRIMIDASRKPKFTAMDENRVFDSIKNMNPSFDADETVHDTEVAESILEDKVLETIEDPDVQAYVQAAESEFWGMQCVDNISVFITPHTALELRKELVRIYNQFESEHHVYTLSYDYEEITLMHDEKKIEAQESIDTLGCQVSEVRTQLEKLHIDEPELFDIVENALDALRKKI